jgi:DNA-binding XRE family transcriptional regulator
MQATEFIKALRKTYSVDYKEGGDGALALRLGISKQTIIKWEKSKDDLKETQIINMLLKACSAAALGAQFHAIKPLVELYPLECSESQQGKKFELFPLRKNATDHQNGVRDSLSNSCGVYIFYDSRGQALYVGKAKKQNLWKEMIEAFNRDRGYVQSIKLVNHDENSEFSPAHEQLKQPKQTSVLLARLSWYFSAYIVDPNLVDDLEALLVRGFSNDLLNSRMEKFGNSR